MAKARLKIALVSLAYNHRGGIERCVAAEAEFLKKAGHRVTVVTAQLEEKPPRGVDCRLVEVPARPWIFKTVAFYLRAPQVVEPAGPFDVVIAHTVYGACADFAWAHSVHRAGLVYDGGAASFRGLRQWFGSLFPLAASLADKTFQKARRCVALSTVGQVTCRNTVIFPRIELIGCCMVLKTDLNRLSAAARKKRRRELGMDGIDFWFSFSGWNWRRKGLAWCWKPCPGTPATGLP